MKLKYLFIFKKNIDQRKQDKNLPECDDDGGEEGAEVIDAGEAKVGQLDGAPLVHEDVGRLDSAVHDALAVQVDQPVQHLPCVVAHDGLAKGAKLFDQG